MPETSKKESSIDIETISRLAGGEYCVVVSYANTRGEKVERVAVTLYIPRDGMARDEVDREARQIIEMDGLHNFKLDTGESGIADVDYKIVSKSEEPTGIFGTTHLNRAGHFVTG